jgi:superfamily II DNA or RNA helicase
MISMDSAKWQRLLWHGVSPWPHQVEAFDRCWAFLQRPGSPARGLVQMPTGTGKSALMRALTHALVEARRPVVIAVPTEEILEQLITDLRRETRTPFYVDKAERRRPATSLITLASQATLWRRLALYPERSVLLFDECHHSGRPAECNVKSLQRFQTVIGLSASPWSPECAEIYQDRILYRYGLSRAIEEGRLCGYVIEPMPEAVPEPTRHELYFCASNARARELAASCPGAAYLGHETEERAELVAGFRAGRVKRLYLNRCLTEGFDCPQVGRVFVDRPTESELLLYQMAGRALRRSHSGKLARLFCREVGALQRALDRAG